jgi:hypothetical protein
MKKQDRLVTIAVVVVVVFVVVLAIQYQSTLTPNYMTETSGNDGLGFNSWNFIIAYVISFLSKIF